MHRPGWGHESASALRVVRPPLLTQRVADLADRAPCTKRFSHRDEQVVVAESDAPDIAQSLLRVVAISFRAHAHSSLELPPFRLGIEPVQLDRLALLFRKAVHADDHALAGLDLTLVLERGLLDLFLDEPLLDRGDGTAELVHALDQLPRTCLELVRQRLDEVRTAERIRGVRATRLVCEQLLRAQRDANAALGRQGERLV